MAILRPRLSGGDVLKTLVLLRHGESTWNKENRIPGWTDVDLSEKGAGQKIYLGDGIWADLVGRYRAGRYQAFEWTFPDFRYGRYDRKVAEIRRRDLAELKANHEDR